MHRDQPLKYFQEIVARLRHPEKGCPWDLKQDHQSLRKYLLEECWEFLDAMDRHSQEDMEEELGDLLLQVYLHSRLLEESTEGCITLDTVAIRISEKMIRRHPHIFDENYNANGLSVEEAWQKIKIEEKGETETPDPFRKHAYLPGLLRIDKILKELKDSGFRFEHPTQALSKVEEEVQEVREVLDEPLRLREELADLILASVSAAAEFGLSSEELLKQAESKLMKRWQKYTAAIASEGLDLNSMTYEEKESLWERLKHGC